MKIKLISIILLTGLLLAISTCTKDIYAPSACFQENILPIFVSNCTMSGCHNSKDKAAEYDLSNYEGIMRGVKPHHPLLSEVYKVIRGNDPSMPVPPYSKLSSTDVGLIKLWINAGAHNTSNCSTCDSTIYSYSGRISGIMKNWCIGCHNSSNKSGNVDLSNYNGVSASASDGSLLGSIKHSPGYLAMPEGGGQISSCEIRVIEKWIAGGHPNN